MGNDAEWKFEKGCTESMDELWGEMIDSIKEGSPPVYPTDLIIERADSEVPVYYNQLYPLASYLDENWDDAKGMDSFDKALMYAVAVKAESVFHERFGELGGEDMLDEVETTWTDWKNAVEEGGPELIKNLQEIIEASEKPAEHLKLQESLDEMKSVNALKPLLKPK